MERDPATLNTYSLDENFNSHAHVERDINLVVFRVAKLNFNSHAHVERDLENCKAAMEEYKISTHTLTWSVTLAV